MAGQFEYGASYGRLNDEKTEVEGGATIWAVGELGGGTTYFSRNNMVGLYRELRKSIQRGNAPDHIIFNGELLPKIPNYITRGGRAESLMLGEYVSDIGSASVSMKPHMSRIANLVERSGDRNGMTYVMGNSDRDNMTVKYDLLVYIYNRKPERLFELFYKVSDRVESEEEIIKSTTNTLDHYERRMKNIESDEKKKNLEARIERIRDKVRAHQNEVDDYRKIGEKYVELIKLWFEENGAMPVNDIISKFKAYSNDELFLKIYLESMGSDRRNETLEALRDEFAKANKNLDAARSSKKQDNEKIEELVEKVKTLAKMMTKLGYENVDSVSRTVGKEQMETGSGASIFRFVNMMPGTKSLSTIAQELSMMEAYATIRDVFGRSARLNIVSDRLSVLNVNNMRVMVTYDPVSYSKSVRKDYSKAIQHVINTSEIPVDMIISGHSYKAGEEAFPWRNRSSNYVYSVVLPTFVDREMVSKAWNTGHKTPFLSAFGSMPITSGFYKITYNGGAFQTEFMTSEYLQISAEKEAQRQAGILISRIKNIKPLGITERNIDDKERAQVVSKLPSELNNRLLNVMLLMHGINPSDQNAVPELLRAVSKCGDTKNPKIKEFADNIVRQAINREYNLRKMHFVVLTDTHIGSPGMGEPATRILDSVVGYVSGFKAFRPFNLLLLGDNIEGNLRNHKYEVNIENNQSNVEFFERFLTRKGLNRNSVEFETYMEEYRALMYERQAIPNPDIQAEKLINIIKPLLRNAGMVVTVSGNHVNKTHEDRSMDESIKLGMLISAIIGEDKVVRAPGGDYGHGMYLIDGKPFFMIHKPSKDPYNQIDKAGIQATTFAGDAHVFRKSIVDNGFQLVSPCLQGINSYAESIGIGVSDSLRGFTMTSLIFDDEHRYPIVSATRLVTLKELEKRGLIRDRNPMIKEFESLKREISGKSRSVKLKQVVGT
ncbi:MAG: hypothetical protein M1122_01495 [Candidatus Marsarchaeota archaeon]|jgi:hypothetical protein|nr:hypothetical protein [Candidatus Marsarchaeota archaeon]